MSYALHPDLLAATEPLTRYRLCEVRLMKDARFPWLVLVPQRDGLRELDDLSPADRARLMEECIEAADLVRAMGEAAGRPVEKLNTAALGNVTPQLHVHVVGRRSDDAAWPRPVWGVGEAEPYTANELRVVRNVADGELREQP